MSFFLPFGGFLGIVMLLVYVVFIVLVFWLMISVIRYLNSKSRK